MKKEKELKKELNTEELNKVLTLSSRILNILYIVIIVVIVFISTIILKEWKIFNFIFRIFMIISPVIIGLIIAWLLNPLVTLLSKKGMKRIWSTTVVYFILIISLILFIWALVPVLSNQINDLTKMIPTIIADAGYQLNNIFDKISNIEGLDIKQIRSGVFTSIEEYGSGLMVSVPNTFVKIVTGLFSGVGQLVVGLLVGFYLLMNFDGANKHLMSLIPQKYLTETTLLFKVIDSKLYKFVKGTILSSTILFVINTIGFAAAGLKAPILFGLFCGITNIIPYIGPYIGGIPAIIVGFSQGTITGLLVLIIIVITQLIEGNILHPLIMSKTMKLHPVTIIVSLLIFGSLFGIVGMVIATPLVSLLKIFFKFVMMKLKLFDMDKYDLSSELD